MHGYGNREYMPKPGQKSVTITEEDYQLAKEKAQALGFTSVAAFVADRIQTARCKKREA